jgi:hypothetical protein
LHLRQGRRRQELSPDTVEAEAISDVQFLDLHNGTTITINPVDRPDLWSFPVEAVGMLWDRRHWFYESNCVVLRWPMSLDPGVSRTVSLSLKIEKTK